MLEVPQAYTARYFETDSDGVEWEYRWVAAGPVGRCHLDHAFTDGDRQSEKIYIPIFNGSLNTEGTKLESKAGVFHSSEPYALQRVTSGVWMMYGRCTCSIHCSL